MSGPRTEQEKIWLALSDLFLDTDVSLFRDSIVRTLRATALEPAQVELILLDEVYPVCIGNLRMIAGEWAGISEEWLFPRCAARAALPTWRKAVGRGLRRRGLRQLVSEWDNIRAALINPP